MATKKTKKSSSAGEKIKEGAERAKDSIENAAQKVSDKAHEMMNDSRSSSRSDVSPTIEPDQSRDADTSSGEVERPIDRNRLDQ